MVEGLGGIGYYINYAGGMHFFRNIAYDNGLDGFMATGGWVDQGVVMANNTFVNSVSAYSLGTGGESCKTATALDTRNTLFLHHRRSAIGVGEAEILAGGHVRMDYNLYFLNGYEPWPQHTPGILSGDVGGGYQEFPTLDQVRASLGLEQHGVEGDPKLAGFDPTVDDGTWQDFRLTTDSSLAIDKGGELPPSLVALLDKLSIESGQKGAALDIGAIELDPDDPDAPYEINVGPASGDGGTEPSPPWGDEDGGFTPGGPDGSTAPSAGAGRDDSGGCSCRTRRGGSTSMIGLLALSGLLLGTGARRRRGFVPP
jgi:MYXO-CTERM domain-containing protein